MYIHTVVTHMLALSFDLFPQIENGLLIFVTLSSFTVLHYTLFPKVSTGSLLTLALAHFESVLKFIMP